MKKQTVVWKKMLKASMAGSLVIAPVITGTSSAQAAPQTYAQTRVYRSYNVYVTLTGRVTSVESNSRFDVQVGNEVYNVYLSTSAPRRLDKGDIVRVYGQRYGNNDIRNASVSIITNTPGNGATQWGDFQTFTGRVTSVESNSRFNVEIGNREYNVYLSTDAPRRLDRGDIVRVHGRRYGDNDIRNASVRIIANTPGNGSNRWGDFRTFTGRVTSVESNSRFNIQEGNTEYNVYLSTNAPRRLDRGDIVRVYGRRYGDNDIRNASVRIITNTPGNGSFQWGDFRTFTGRVTSVESNSRFNIRVGNREYNVYLSTNAPRRLDRGDTVRVYGRRYGDNDIRNASVRILTNTPGNGSFHWGDFQTFTGRVTSVESNSRFNIEIGNKEYNVYLSTNAPSRLDRGDTVRVYGRRYGDNDIRNANVYILNNTPGSTSNQWGNYETLTGIAGTVQAQRFRLLVGGTTYDVYASSRLPAGLNQGDTVRVYGRRYGKNDIRNATVSIIRNTGNPSGQYGDYRTFTGTVTDVESASKFDVRIGGKIYNVYPSGNAARRVDKGDIVRIYGQRHGDNDIRNANVVVVRNR